MPITAPRLAEIKAFKNVDFSDCPPLTGEQAARLRSSRHRERAAAHRLARQMAEATVFDKEEVFSR
ncbi:hypothetical protein FACS1894139_16940 [Planctomycetales bacterium]|nr:hypothetical protein FACS1894107_16780 [Planctomycetales bacterium]GHS99705.1 hypothetical protein FACS1894108_10200 [Planctomycetales bacterium]GHT07916.1 hypothetical protein FACS1894139_16940 [Planctomycetales bacterium]